MSAVIVADGLTRTFGEHRGVTDVTFTVDDGEIFGFLGPNGAGKSTTIRLLLGLMRPDTGSITSLGCDPITDSVALHRHVGYLPGELAWFANLTGRVILERFAGVRGLQETTYRDELVERFDAELDRPVGQLSKGNRQKLGIVAAFMHRPRLLVLDEPTSGLDPLLQDSFARLMRESADAGATVFLSSHELDEVQRVVERLAIIRDGRIVVTDTIDGLRRRAPRRITLVFDRPTDPAAFAALEGVTLTHADDHEIALAVTGPMAPVLQCAAHHDVVDLTAPPTDLDTLFLSYYRDEDHAT